MEVPAIYRKERETHLLLRPLQRPACGSVGAVSSQMLVMDGRRHACWDSSHHTCHLLHTPTQDTSLQTSESQLTHCSPAPTPAPPALFLNHGFGCPFKRTRHWVASMIESHCRPKSLTWPAGFFAIWPWTNSPDTTQTALPTSLPPLPWPSLCLPPAGAFWVQSMRTFSSCSLALPSLFCQVNANPSISSQLKNHLVGEDFPDIRTRPAPLFINNTYLSLITTHHRWFYLYLGVFDSCQTSSA